MDQEKVYIESNPTGPTIAISIDPDRCIGCNACANICRMQTLLPSPELGKPPILAYPDECWYCACCVEVCRTGALQMRLPIGQRVMFKRKSTGEVFRLGQKNGPEKTYFNPPYGYRKLGGTEDGQ
jgi:NAD-dependent dihydropyrimidine dehydrogenase PreA subunit